jgi:DNA polymerase III epsilon subunit-like protein
MQSTYDTASLPFEALILDTETTGIKPPVQVIELAFIGLAALEHYPGTTLITTAKQHKKFHQRYKPTKAIEPTAERIHGISFSDVVDCPVYVHKDFPISDTVKYVIGHSISYDLRALSDKVSGFDFAQHFQVLPICTLAIARKHWKDLPSKKLTEIVNTMFPAVAAALVKDAHAAMRDSLLCLLLVHALVEQFECKTWKDIYDLQS